MPTAYYQSFITFGLLAVFLILYILFLLAQQKLLNVIRLENREMNPGQVWWQLIPIIGWVWSYITVRRISTSIYNELNSPIDDSIFGSETNVPRNPLYGIGLTYCILFSLSILPFGVIKGIFSLAATVCWIIYWVQLSSHTRKIKRRALMMAPLEAVS